MAGLTRQQCEGSGGHRYDPKRYGYGPNFGPCVRCGWFTPTASSADLERYPLVTRPPVERCSGCGVVVCTSPGVGPRVHVGRVVHDSDCTLKPDQCPVCVRA